MTTLDLELPIERMAELFPQRERTNTYTVGQTCVSIERDPAGGVWLQVDSHHRFWVPDRNVRCIYEKRSTEAKATALPAYVVPLHEGFACSVCQREFGSVQAVKVHHGRAHQET